MDITILLSFMGATALLAISPGPDNIFVLIQSVTNGVKYGLATVLGLISGCIVHTTLVAFGASAIIKANDNLYLTLKIFGASYLLFLAYKVFKSEDIIAIDGKVMPKKKLGQLFKQGVIMNVLNPKVSIFFLALFPGFLFSNTLTTESQFFILGFVFMGVSFLIFSIIAVLAGSIASYLKTHSRIGFVLKWLQIIVFIGIAIFILFSD